MANDTLINEIIQQHHLATEYNVKPSNLIIPSRLNSEIFEIRILTLFPGGWETPLTCNLQKYIMIAAPPFSALSYQWGNLKNQKSILINGVQRTIGSNLESALRHIRHVNYHVNLWVDAVCINQSDLIERVEQVGIMDHIYSKANRVFLWLGNGDAGSYFVLRFITENFKDGDFVFPPGDAEEMIKAYVLAENILCRPYWSRIWIAQELILPPEDPIVICGTHSMPWKLFIHGIERIDEIVTSYSKSSAGINTDRIFRQRMAFFVNPVGTDGNERMALTCKDSRLSREAGKGMSGILALYRRERAGKSSPPEEDNKDSDAQALRLARMVSGLAPEQPKAKLGADYPKVDFKPRALHEIISLSLSKEATDSRDLVYGILGLVYPVERAKILVDYSSTTPTEVFRQAFQVIWTSDNPRSLEAIDAFVFCFSSSGYPSWVMDLRQNAMSRHKLTALYLRNSKAFQKKHAVEVLDDGKVLHVKGIYIDSIESAEFLDEDDFEYLAREMYADMTSKARVARERPIPESHHLYDLEEMKKVGSIDNTFAGGADSAHILINSIVANRSFFVTAAGLYGIAHPEIEVGDHIIFLYGMRVPLVVRSSGGYDKIVGPARVSGFTNALVLDAMYSSGEFKALERNFKIA